MQTLLKSLEAHMPAARVCAEARPSRLIVVADAGIRRLGKSALRPSVPLLDHIHVT
jgi:hypothetical protein